MYVGVTVAKKKITKNHELYKDEVKKVAECDSIKIYFEHQYYKELNLSDSLTVKATNLINEGYAKDDRIKGLESKISGYKKFNKVCYQKVLERKGLKRTWIYVEVPCERVL